MCYLCTTATGPPCRGHATVPRSTCPPCRGYAAVPRSTCPVGRGYAAVPVEVLQASGLHNSSQHPSPSACKVLWLDTLHGPHICTSIYRELAAHCPAKENLHFVCLDILGGQRENFYAINRNIEALIRQFKPQLVVIDDIDHFMPFCGVHVATEFCRIVRDVTNHTDTAFLFIGYNHLGKKASTTGNLGKYLFLDASDVFSLSTQREVTTVRLARSYDLSRSPDDTEYRFTIGDDNLPHEVQRTPEASSPEVCDSTTSDSSNHLDSSNKDKEINNSLTFPTPLPNQEPSHIASSSLHCTGDVSVSQAASLKKQTDEVLFQRE